MHLHLHHYIGNNRVCILIMESYHFGYKSTTRKNETFYRQIGTSISLDTISDNGMCIVIINLIKFINDYI